MRHLFRSYFRRDDEAFKSAAEEIIRAERVKNHRLLADDLERILMNGAKRPGGQATRKSEEIPKDRERGFPLFTIEEFDYGWRRLIAPPKTLQVLEQLTLEYQNRDVLMAAGIGPKQRVLFYGPPGSGKTLAAKVLAGVMSYPLITVRFDAIVSSYLGETAANLRRVFEFIERGQWIVLFDEFDAIGKSRDDQFEHGELKRVVNSLLQLLDAYKGESLLIAATNHEGLLDSAVWRRFDAVVEFPRPKLQDRVLMLRLFLGGIDVSQVDLHEIAKKLDKATGADVERFAVEAVRRALIQGRMTIGRSDATAALQEYRDRTRLMTGLRAMNVQSDAEDRSAADELRGSS